MNCEYDGLSEVILSLSHSSKRCQIGLFLQSFFLFKDCNTEKMTKLKAIPNTSCDSTSQEICVTPECPVVFSKKVCDVKKKSHVALVPQVQY